MPLEAEFCDILKKARSGQGLSVADISARARVSIGDVSALERGESVRDRAAVHALAEALRLRAEPLAQIVLDQWEPMAQNQPEWIQTVQGSIGGYGVHGYIVHDHGEAVAIDTAYNAAAMIKVLHTHHLRLVGICLTHGHADNLRLFGKMYDVPTLEARILEFLDKVDLIDRRQDRARTFSRGMQQRLAIARALLHDPAVVLLDEPFTGLDPHGSDRLEEMLHLLRDGKRTVVMTIHDLERGWAMCDRALVLARGKFVYQARTAEVRVVTFRAEFKRVTQ